MNTTHRIIKADRSIIPSLDISTLEELKKIVLATHDLEGISAYKIGFELVIPFGMKKVVEEIRKITKKPIIYDHQKAATDVPFTGEKFAKACKESGVDAIILFPLTGPVTMTQWIKSGRAAGLGVIVGGEMTHEAFISSDGGWIQDDAPSKIYTLAAKQGITEFVVPGNKPHKIKQYRELMIKEGVKDPVLYSPGLISQGGDINKSKVAAGKCWHAIVGRALYETDNIRDTAQKLIGELQ